MKKVAFLVGLAPFDWPASGSEDTESGGLIEPDADQIELGKKESTSVPHVYAQNVDRISRAARTTRIEHQNEFAPLQDE